MSSFGSQMRKRLAELNKAGKDVPKIMMEVAEGTSQRGRSHSRNQYAERTDGAALGIGQPNETYIQRRKRADSIGK